MKRYLPYIFLLLQAAPLKAEVSKTAVAVLSVGSGVYLEAFAAFQAVYGAEVRRYDLSRQKPEINSDTRVVVAFGGKAANYAYPEVSRIIYCLAPGVFARNAADGNNSSRVSLIPGFPDTFKKLKEIQPGLKRLWLLWAVPENSPYTQTVKADGETLGIQVTAVMLAGPDSLPGVLRRAMGAADAIWVAPDPLIVTPQSLRILKEYSWDNGIPFYGSTKSMTREGAAASLGVSFTEMGKAAAGAALSLERGETVPEVIFADKIEITLNASAAKKLGLVFPRDIIAKAGYLFP